MCNGGTGGTCNFANGAEIFQGGIGVNSASYLRFIGFTVKGGLSVSSLAYAGGPGSGHTVHDVVFQGLNLQGRGDVTGTRSAAPPYHIAFLGGTYGGTNVSMPALYITGTSGTVIRGITFKNILTGACIGDGLCHSEGVYVGDNTGLLIDRNSFANIDVYDIFHSNGSIGVNGHETVTNNYFGLLESVRNNDSLDGRHERHNPGRARAGQHLPLRDPPEYRSRAGGEPGNLDDYGQPLRRSRMPDKADRTDWRLRRCLRRNLGIVECRSSAGLIANGNQTIQQLGIGGGGGLWAEARARWMRTSFWNREASQQMNKPCLRPGRRSKVLIHIRRDRIHLRGA